MKTYRVNGIEWDTDGNDPQECGLPTDTTIAAENEESVADGLSDRYGYCVESIEGIEEISPKEGVKARTMELLRNHSSLIEEKIDKALMCGAINIEDYEDDYELPRIILHAVMKAMVDETRPLFNPNRKESDNLYIFL